ncbi:MAG: ATP phosphoribosyltransferase [Hyphomicrobiaceae bacterium]
MSDASTLIVAVPSKGRLMEKSLEVFATAGMEIVKLGHERGYRGAIVGLADVEIAFMSAGEIAAALRHGRIHLGITGEDLVREESSRADEYVSFLKRLGFGEAKVVVAVPKCWVDVTTMSDLSDAALRYRRHHVRRMRVATKYTNLTREFFTRHGVSDYRIIESLGATEGTPAAGTAELIVDITSTGSTLEANGLKTLSDGVILNSEANLIASRTAPRGPGLRAAENEILRRLEL